MARRAGPGEASAFQASGGALDVGGGLQAAEPGGPPGPVGRLGTLQATKVGRAAEAALSRPEAVQEGEALAAGPEAGLVVEAIMRVGEGATQGVVEEEVEVGEGQAVGEAEERLGQAQAAGREGEVLAAEAREEKPAQSERREPRRAQASARSALEALQALQLEMEPVNKQASWAQCRLKLRTRQRQKPHLELRSTIIQGIRGFWATVFANHPEMSAMIAAHDENMLSYMKNLQVEEVGRRRICCKITLFFWSNPYFRNNVIVKEYAVHVSGYRASCATPIQWYQHYEREAYSCRHHDSHPTFTCWLSDHNLAGTGRIAEIIIMDLWPNPLQYFVRSTAPDEGSESTAGVDPGAGP